MLYVRETVLAFLCLIQYGNLIPTAANSPEQWTYSFRTNTVVGNNLSTDAVSQWSLAGKFIIQTYPEYKIMKLDELKTSAYNGPTSGLLNLQEVPVPRDTDVLKQSFVAYYNRNYDKLESLSFLPNEPEWSMNIKKAIASVYQVDFVTDKQKFVPNNKDADDETVASVKQEQNILGKCAVKYKYLPAYNQIKISKEIDYSKCETENAVRYTWGNVALGFFAGTTDRHYEYDRAITDTTVPPKSINSETKLRYWIMNSDRTVFQINQTQKFALLETSTATKREDISKHTAKKNPAFTFENDQRDADGEENANGKLLDVWLKQTNIFNNHLNCNTSDHVNIHKFDIIEKIRSTISSMDLKTLNQLLEKYSNDEQKRSIHESLLPYAGTIPSVKFIKQLLVTDRITQPTGYRMLAFFPLYVKSPTKELLAEMEDVLNMDNITNAIAKDTYILSFSNLVAQMYRTKLDQSNNLNESESYYSAIADKYVNKYYKLYTAQKDYNTRMKYILGLMNMGKSATKYLMSIVKDTSELRHSRVLALYAVKPEMIYKKHEAYESFWPILRNTSEPFELRAGALSLLLESNINSSELYAILNYVNQTSYDAAHQHLHNYFYTSVQAGKMDCDHCRIKALANELLHKLHPLETNQGLMTRHHQISYSDVGENFASSLTVHVVANPTTNFINVFQLTLNNFNNLQNIGMYSIYVKAEGLSERLYKEEYERHFPVKELFKLLEDIKLVITNDHKDLHIEIILYYERSAVFALHINNENFEDVTDLIDQLINYFGNNEIITLRDVRKTHFVSDLGTPIHATLNYEHVLNTQFTNVDKLFLDENDKDEDENYISTKLRSAWMSKHKFISYNPLTNINHGTSKIFSNQNFLKFKMEYNVYDLSIKWNDDNSYLDTLIDFKHATFAVNDDDLNAYCSQCSPVYFVAEQNKSQKNISLWLWAKQVNIRNMNGTSSRYTSNPLHEIIGNSKVSYSGLPFAQPFVQLAYIADYAYYIPEYEVSSTSINTDPILSEPTESTLKITFINDALDENFKLNLNFNITLALIQRIISNNKTHNHYNFNIKRQELAKGVYYGVHYDDNGKSIKFDIDSEFDFVPTLPDTDMFSLEAAAPILCKTSIHFEKDKSVFTDIEITSLFSVSDEQKYAVKSSKNYEICQIDFKREQFKDILMRHSPPTKACYMASSGMSTYDKYAIYMEFKNVSQDLQNTLENDILRPITNESPNKRIITQSTFNASMIYSALNSTVNITVDNNHIVSNYSVPELFRPKVLLKPTSRLIEELRYTAFGLDNICILTPRHVISFSGKVVEYDADTSIVPLIECTNNTRVGVISNRFTYKLWSDENTFQLGKKAGGYYVMRNGKYLKRDIKAEDYEIDFINDHTFHITTSRIELYYNGEYLTIKIRSTFMSRMCGTCMTGDFSLPSAVNKYFH